MIENNQYYNSLDSPITVVEVVDFKSSEKYSELLDTLSQNNNLLCLQQKSCCSNVSL